MIVSRDLHETFWAKTEMRPKTHVSEIETRLRWDVAASKMLAQTLKLPRLLGASTSRRDVFRGVGRMVKHIDNEKNIRIN